MRWVIFCWSRSDRAPELKKGDVVVCADSGLEYARRCGVKPHIVLGDFDSYAGAFPDDCEVIRLPVVKDDTDTMFAVRLGLKRGVKEFLIAGGFGGREDHTFGALQTLNFILSHGADGEMSDGNQWARILRGPGELTVHDRGGYVSLFALTPRCEGITLTGFRYPMTDDVLTYDFPLGVSNEITAPSAHLSFSEGRLLIMGASDPV